MTVPIASDDEVWQLATPAHFLLLLDRLDISAREVARLFAVPPSNVSMWRHGTRAVPRKHVRTLQAWARLAYEEARERALKAQHLAATARLGQALYAEHVALVARWKAEVLADRSTYACAIDHAYTELGTIVRQAPYRSEDVAQVTRLAATLVEYMQRLMPPAPETHEESGHE